MDFDWSDAAVYELGKLAAAGYNASIIAESLTMEFGCALSRSAVLGKMHREGMAMKRPRSKFDKQKPRRRRRNPPSRLPSRFNTAARSAPPPQDETDAAALGPTVGILGLSHDTCRWPYGQRAENMMYCGRTPEPEKPYCYAHCRLAYVHSPSRHRRPPSPSPSGGRQQGLPCVTTPSQHGSPDTHHDGGCLNDQRRQANRLLD